MSVLQQLTPTLSIAGRTNDVVLLRSYAAAVSTFAVEFGEGSYIEAALTHQMAHCYGDQSTEHSQDSMK